MSGSLITLGVEWLVDTARGLAQGVRRTPLFVWLYLGFMVYIYRRMTRDFLGMGTRAKRVIGRAKVDLTKEEEAISENVLDPAALSVRFDDIGGLEEQKKVLVESVLWPFQHPELFAGSVAGAPTGILLYGPPGTGKTLLAKALAKELDSYFIEVSLDKLFSKWVGESEKLAAAVFSLARKLQPCVIFIDEIDALLSARSSNDTVVYTHAKTIFMTQWDGISQTCDGPNGNRVLVVGATNRLRSLDDAVVRRLPVRLEVPAPNAAARSAILAVLLRNVRTAPGFSASEIARWTDGYTGSDLKELVKAAALLPMRELLAAGGIGGSEGSPKAGFRLPPGTPTLAAAAPPLRMAHFQEAMTRVVGSLPKASGPKVAPSYTFD